MNIPVLIQSLLGLFPFLTISDVFTVIRENMVFSHTVFRVTSFFCNQDS